MIKTTDGYMRLEYFTQTVAADSRRKEFDIKNHSLIYEGRKPDFLFIGDSITHYWELNNYFYQNGKLIVNRGIGGDTTAYLKKRFFVDAIQLKPQYCIMGIGINDSIDLEGDYWKRLEPRPYAQVISEAQKNIEDIIIRAGEGDLELILTSILPINIPISLHEEARIQYVEDMNRWISKTAKDYGKIFVDYYKVLLDPGTGRIKDGTTYDGLHPNAVGYRIITEVLRETLKNNNIEI